MNFGKIILEIQKFMTLLNLENDNEVSNQNKVFHIIMKSLTQIYSLTAIQDQELIEYFMDNSVITGIYWRFRF